MFIDALDIDYNKLREESEKLRKILSEAKEVHIFSEKGTNLTFSITGRTISIDDGIISNQDVKEGTNLGELPTGEVFTTPIENSAHGKAIFESPTIGSRHTIKNLMLRFESGNVVEAKAEEGLDVFKKRLEQATGDKDKIAEFAVGMNPNMSVNYPLSNEKARGTVHIAIGKNIHLGGKNQSSIHWDFIMHKPTVFVDEKKIIEQGKLFVDER